MFNKKSPIIIGCEIEHGILKVPCQLASEYVAHVKLSRPDSGPEFKVRVSDTFQCVPFWFSEDGFLKI